LLYVDFYFIFKSLYPVAAYDLATQCPSRRASARRHAAKCTVPQMSFTGTTSLPQSRPHSRQHAGLKDLVLSQGPSPNISLNPSPNYSPQPRTSRQAQLAHAVAHENKNDKAPDDEWDDIDKVQNIYYSYSFLNPFF